MTKGFPGMGPGQGTTSKGREERIGSSVSLLLCSLRLCSLRRRARLPGFDAGDGAVVLDKGFVGYAPDVGLGHLVNAFDLAKEFPPVSIAGLGLAELQGEALVVGQPANQVGFGPGLDRLQLVI